jgi:hypothetical protein
MQGSLRPPPRHWQQNPCYGGYILLLVMVFLLLLAVIAGTALRVSALEFRMAGNDQFREQALQQALGVAQALAVKPEHFPLDLEPGESLCATSASCTRPILPAVPMADALPPGTVLQYSITRRGPLFAAVPELRLAEARASSASGWRAAHFEVQVVIDGNAPGLGSARVVQGVALLLPLESP